MTLPVSSFVIDLFEVCVVRMPVSPLRHPNGCKSLKKQLSHPIGNLRSNH